MNNKEESLHSLLVRQLSHSNLNVQSLPKDIEAWQAFVSRVNKIYQDADQERYLLERSMDISSREMLDLNKMLEDAQHIAHLGYLQYDKLEDILTLSHETYYLLGFDESEQITFVRITEMMPEEQREHFNYLIERSFEKGLDGEIETRIINGKGNPVWLYIKFHPYMSNKDNNYRYLSVIVMDITKQKEAEQEMQKLNSQLVVTAHDAGMAEVAMSVLHNIGNILNSATVSITLMNEKIATPYINKLEVSCQLIKGHLTKKDNYLTNDEKGKLLPDYLCLLSHKLNENYTFLTHEIHNVASHLQHIKDIVAMQKDISGLSGLTETVLLYDVIELSIQLSFSTLPEKDIQIIKNYAEIIYLSLDKTRLLQILVNLLRNAKEALVSKNTAEDKILQVTTRKSDINGQIEIIINDNGVGIPTDYLTKIFSFGFTTKPTGHGYGLHSSAIAAKQMGGSLTVKSEGMGKGACFILTVPINANVSHAEVNEHEAI